MKLNYKDIGVVTKDLTASRDFYVNHLGFQPVFVSDWYIHLANGPVQIGLMKEGVEHQPSGLQAANNGGVWFSFDVADVDAEYRRLAAAGARIDGEPKDEKWGERHFVVWDPNGLAINISMAIPADEEFMRSANQLTATV